MSARRRDIRTERQAREIARWAGWGTPMPEREAEELHDAFAATDLDLDVLDSKPLGGVVLGNPLAGNNGRASRHEHVAAFVDDVSRLTDDNPVRLPVAGHNVAFDFHGSSND